MCTLLDSRWKWVLSGDCKVVMHAVVLLMSLKQVSCFYYCLTVKVLGSVLDSFTPSSKWLHQWNNLFGIIMLYSNWSRKDRTLWSWIVCMGVTIAALYAVSVVCAWKGLRFAWLNAGHAARDLVFCLGPAKSSIILHSDWATCQATSAFGGKFDIPIPHDELGRKSLLGVWLLRGKRPLPP